MRAQPSKVPFLNRRELVLSLNSTDKGWNSLPSVVTTSFFQGCLHLSLHHAILAGAMHVNLNFLVEKSITITVASHGTTVTYSYILW